MTRDEALGLLRQHVKAQNLINHCIATEAIMRALAARFGEDADVWGVTGLLHDLDLEEVAGDMTRHARVTADILSDAGFPRDVIDAVLAHNGDILGIRCETRFECALAAAESLSGLVVATALVQPSKKLADVKPESVRKRMKEKRFAANVSRERIGHAERLGIPFEEFVTVSVVAMQGIGAEIGL